MSSDDDQPIFTLPRSLGLTPDRWGDTHLDLPEGLEFDQLKLILHYLRRWDQGIQWYYVDFWQYAEFYYPATYMQLLPDPEEMDSWDLKTLHNWLNVGKKFPPTRRIKGLVFSAYVEVLGVDDADERQRILQTARDSKLTVRDIRHLAVEWKIQHNRIDAMSDINGTPSASQATDETPAIPAVQVARTVPAIATYAGELSLPEQVQLVNKLVDNLRQYGMETATVQGLPELGDDDDLPPPPANDPYARSLYSLDRWIEALPTDSPLTYVETFRKFRKWLKKAGGDNVG